MLATCVCPSRAELERLLSANAPASAVEELALHLEACPGCARVFADVCAESPFAASLRQRSTDLLDPSDREALDRLMDRLTGLVPPGDDTTPLPDTVSPASGTSRAGYEYLAPPQAPDELGRLGGYRILKVLGKGAMGIVFEAEDTLLHRRVALKVMQPALAEKEVAHKRFLQEARSVAKLAHDHVVAVLQVGEDRGLPFLSMPLLPGQTLEERLQREKRLRVDEVLRVGREAALGLAAAHAAGLIHRDVKPSNLYLWLRTAPDGVTADRVQILDFGLARPAADETGLTAPGMIMGTQGYLAPELAADPQNVDPCSDLFSLGVVLYRMTTGAMPFRGDNMIAFLHALAVEQPLPPREHNPDVPAALSDLILRLLAKDPAARPSSATEVAAALAALASDSPPAPPRRRRRLLVAAVVLLLGGIVLAAPTIIRKKQVAPISPPEKVDPVADEAAIKKLGGRVNGKPVTQVILAKSSATDADLRLVRGFPHLQLLDASGLLIRDADLDHLKGLTSLRWLNVSGTRITDAGLERLKGPTELESLNLGNTRITNAGLVQLKGLTKLTTLDLCFTDVDDAGMKHLRSLERLGVLFLEETKVGDAGLAALKDLEGITELRLGKEVTDKGLAELKTKLYLRKLTLNGNQKVTGEGLAQLRGLTRLRQLVLNGSRLENKDLVHLKVLTNLEWLDLRNTKVTEAGVRGQSLEKIAAVGTR